MKMSLAKACFLLVTVSALTAPAQAAWEHVWSLDDGIGSDLLTFGDDSRRVIWNDDAFVYTGYPSEDGNGTAPYMAGAGVNNFRSHRNVPQFMATSSPHAAGLGWCHGSETWQAIPPRFGHDAVWQTEYAAPSTAAAGSFAAGSAFAGGSFAGYGPMDAYGGPSQDGRMAHWTALSEPFTSAAWYTLSAEVRTEEHADVFVNSVSLGLVLYNAST